jgi:DNA-binding CsgD family transcriptional regulator
LLERHDVSAAQLGSSFTVAPHIGQGFVLTDCLKASPMQDQRLRGQLDRLRCGMVFCDAEGRVDWLNRSAQRLLATGPLRLVGSHLFVDSEAETETLMNELAEGVAAAGNAVRYLRLGQGELTLHVAIQPQPGTQPSAVVLTLTSPSQVVDIPTDALIRLFDLTPTEAGLVAALATGSTLEQYAQQRGASVGTARVHLKHVQRKTGARRQSDLVRLVWSSAAAHLSPGFVDPAEASRPLHLA